MERDNPQGPGRSASGSEHAGREPVHHGPDADRHGAQTAGTGIGAAAGGIAGAAAGSVVGPIGTAVGAVIGALGGGLMGRAVAETIDPTREDEHWRGAYADRPYVEEGTGYEAYRPAYRFGWESYGRYGQKYRSFDEADAALARDWERGRGESDWDWTRARSAARDAWDRIARLTERSALPGGEAGGQDPGA
jgi:hypothetical protein